MHASTKGNSSPTNLRIITFSNRFPKRRRGVDQRRIIGTQTGQLKQEAQFRQGKHKSAKTGDSTFPISQITIVQFPESYRQLTLDCAPECMLLLMAAGAIQIGQVAKRTALSVDAIRFYERRHLLPKAIRSPGGFRLYTTDDI